MNDFQVLLDEKNAYISVLFYVFLEVFLLFEEENWLSSEWQEDEHWLYNEWENNKQVEQKEWKKKKIKR